MSRDSYLDAMLRHLGAAYYESLHGRASAADVARARAAVEDHLAEQPGAADHPDLLPVAVRLIWDIDGVIDVIEKLGSPAPASG